MTMTGAQRAGAEKVALFECYGLLEATVKLFTVAEAEIFARRGRTFEPKHKREILGQPITEVGRRMAVMLGVP